MNKKVCVVTSRHPAYDQRILLREAVSLANRGYEVVLYAPNAEAGSFNGVRIQGFHQSPGYLGRLASIPRLIRMVAAERPFICHVHDPDLISLAPLLRWLWNSRVVVDIHEYYTSRFSHWGPVAGPLASKAVAFALRLGALGADRIITAVPGICAELELPIWRTTVLWNYPLLTSSDLETRIIDDTNPLTAIYVGTLSHIYGSFVILEAARRIPSVQFLIIGRFYDTETERSFKETIKALPNVRFVGYVPPFQLANWWSLADVGLCIWPRTPALDGALPTKLVEYMQAGLAVITTNTTLSEQVVLESDCGLVIDKFDSQKLVEALAYMEMHRAEVREMGRRAKARAVTELNWQSEEEKLLALYEGLVN